MAASCCYRHVELDRIGSGKRRVNSTALDQLSNLFQNQTLSEAPRQRRSMVSNLPLEDLEPLNIQEAKKEPAPPGTRRTLSTDRTLSDRPFVLNVPARDPVSDPVTNPAKKNPVTGEGYEDLHRVNQAPLRRRVPPGGYSSKLW